MKFYVDKFTEIDTTDLVFSGKVVDGNCELACCRNLFCQLQEEVVILRVSIELTNEVVKLSFTSLFLAESGSFGWSLIVGSTQNLVKEGLLLALTLEISDWKISKA